MTKSNMTSTSLPYRYDGIASIVVITWKITKNNFPISQTPFVAFTYRDGDNLYGPEKKYKIEQSGIVVKESCKRSNNVVNPGDVLFIYELCTHDTLMKDLCAVCGVNINKLDTDQQKEITANTSVSMVHSIPELRVSRKMAEGLGRADETRLLADRKLVLLVDLDQTIIHSTNQNVPTDISEIFHYQLYGPTSPWYHTKFRPFMMEFLEEISKYYQLHICTFGARRYAHQIAHLIDPNCRYFPKDRILSRDEFFDPCSKTGNMKSLFPCGDSMVCIIDDRIDVWKYAANVVHVKPYICFKTDDINAPEKLNIGFKGSETNYDELEEKNDDEGEKSTDPEKEDSVQDETSAELNNETTENKEDENKDNENDEAQNDTKEKENDQKKQENKEFFKILLEDNDDYLLHLKDILIRIHTEYFREFDDKKKYRTEGEEIVIPDLKIIIPRVRRRVLHGVNIVFSGVIATNISPKQNRFYRLAESLGAIITEDVIVNGSPRTTHLVAAKWGTIKVNRCMKYPTIKMVTPEWLFVCAERWEKVSEELFALTKTTVYDMNTRDDHKKIFIPYYRHGEDEHDKGPSTSGISSPNASPKTILEMSPLANFSTNQIDEMEKEVEDEISGDDDEDNESGDDGDYEDSQSINRLLEGAEDDDEESISYAEEGEYPQGWRPEDSGKSPRKYPLKRSREDFDENEVEESDNNDSLPSSSSEADSIGSVDEEMVAALEREFNS